MKSKKIAIIGAGPGGLSTAILLASKGFDVSVFERFGGPGGRTAELEFNRFRFDIGPTFFMMRKVLDEIFEEAGFVSDDFLEFIRLDPMYQLILPDNRQMNVFESKEKMSVEMERVFPGEGNGVELFYAKEKKRYERLMPLLQAENNSFLSIFSVRFLKAIPYLSIGKSLFGEMGNYFKGELARLSFTFQSKYLGMSPWECPGAFGLVPYIEHSQGVYHIKGGLSQITKQMALIAQKRGVKIYYNSPVKRVVTENGIAKGVELASGEKFFCDEVVINADFGYAMENLFDKGVLKKYKKEKLEKKKISCSIFMLYLGVNKQYKLPHNTIVFAKDYKKNVSDVFEGRLSGENISFYVRDTSVTDPDLAPEGQSALYVLVPVPNVRSGINWDAEKKQIRKNTINALKERLGLFDIEENIVAERICTPNEWEKDFYVYKGAVFNLAHSLKQMLWFRPHNKFEEVKNCYLTGGGTHPGSGLPTIFESGRIVAKLIAKKYES